MREEMFRKILGKRRDLSAIESILLLFLFPHPQKQNKRDIYMSWNGLTLTK